LSQACVHAGKKARKHRQLKIIARQKIFEQVSFYKQQIKPADGGSLQPPGCTSCHAMLPRFSPVKRGKGARNVLTRGGTGKT